MPIDSATSDTLYHTTVLAPNTTFEIDVAGSGGALVYFYLGSTWDVNIHFEATVDGSNWFTISGCNIYLLNGEIPTSISEDGPLAFSTVGMSKLRFTSDPGTTSINIYARTSKSTAVIFQIQDTTFVSVASSVLPTGAATEATLAAINAKLVSGTDIGDVTINNTSGAGAVNIQDGGNSITVDGTVAATQSGTWNITNISGTISLPTGASTSALQTTGNASLASIDGKLTLNYGVATAALRTASQIGNTTGQADFNAGTTGAQTLRASVNITRNGTELDYNFGTVGVNTLRTAAQIGNATGTADFNAGATGAQTLRVTANQGGTWILGANSGVDIGDVTINNAAGAAAVNIQDGGNSITVDGTVSASNFPTTVDTNYGTVGANTLRGAAQIGNATGAADFNYGVVGAQTLRTASEIGNATGAALFGAGTTTAQVLRVVLPTDQTVIPVQGQKTNNNAAPGATNVGVLPAIANAAAPSWTEGNQVALSTDLTGNARVKDIADGPVAPGTVADNSTLIGAQFNTTLPTLTNTQQAALQVDSRGRLIVATAAVDQGRNQTNFFMAIQIVTTNTDALLSLTGYKAGAAVGATTTPAVVTAGKTLRITSITMSYTTIITTPGSVRFTLRANLSGVVAIGSPAVCNWEVGEPTGIAPVAGKKNTVHLAFPDGLEFAAGTGIGISQVGLNTVGAAAAVGYGQITINGFEY